MWEKAMLAFCRDTAEFLETEYDTLKETAEQVELIERRCSYQMSKDDLRTAMIYLSGYISYLEWLAEKMEKEIRKKDATHHKEPRCS